MAKPDKEKLLSETRDSLRRIQDFSADSIARTADLGKDLNFAPAVPGVQRLQELFLQISEEVLEEFSSAKLTAVKQQADAQFSYLQGMLNFAVTDQNPKGTRDSLILAIENSYDTVFEGIWPAIAYSVRRSTDFARLERDARAAIQSIDDRTHQIETDLKTRQAEADQALEAIRKVAAEQGVSQQAIFFKNEAEHHSKEAAGWLWTTRIFTGVLTIFAASTLILHKLPFFAPSSPAEAIQFGIGKVLVFATLAYFLVLASRNYMAHRHNAIVNKHRQNSLVTYRALVESAGDQANRDIILTKAADSIFGQQATGFTKNDGEDGKAALSMVSVGSSMLRSPPIA